MCLSCLGGSHHHHHHHPCVVWIPFMVTLVINQLLCRCKKDFWGRKDATETPSYCAAAKPFSSCSKWMAMKRRDPRFSSQVIAAVRDSMFICQTCTLPISLHPYKQAIMSQSRCQNQVPVLEWKNSLLSRKNQNSFGRVLCCFSVAEHRTGLW